MGIETMTPTECGYSFGVILVTEIIPVVIGLYIGWKCISYFTRSNNPEEEETNEKQIK